jgi:hypothetical protein
MHVLQAHGFEYFIPRNRINKKKDVSEFDFGSNYKEDMLSY